MKKDQLLALLKTKYACDEATAWVRSSKPKTAAGIWNACENPSWMLWIAARVGVDQKLLVSCACVCARQALRHVPAGEDRPRLAIETAERWVKGEATIEEVRSARRGAWDARDEAWRKRAAAADAADAADAAYAAYDAATAAYTAAAATAAYTAYAAATAADAAADAYAAAYADARKRSLARSADLIRKVVPAKMIVALAQGGAR